MELEKILFKLLSLKGASSLYQPLYGFTISEPQLNQDVSLNAKSFEAMVMRNMTAKIEKFNNRFELIKNFIPVNSNCLDYGCNIGYNAFLISEIEGVSVTGVDKDKKTIPIAELLLEYNSLENINFVRDDCSKYLEWKEDGFYDCIICLLVGHHILNAFSRNLPQSYSELDSISDESKKCLKLFFDLISILKKKSKRFIIQLRLGVNGKHFTEKKMDYSSYKDDFFIDYLNDYFSFSNIIRVPATPYSYASPHPLYIFDS